MTETATENPVPQDSTEIKSDVAFRIPQAELVEKIGQYNLFITAWRDGFAAYDLKGQDGEKQLPLHLESYAKEEGSASYYSGCWRSAAPIGEFLGQIDRFFSHHAAIDPNNSNKVTVAISGDEGIRAYDGERPITPDDLKRIEEPSIGSNLELLRFLRVENNLGAFTWDPTETGFIVMPSNFSDQPELQSSLIEIYQASQPTVPKEVFQRALAIVAADKFQNPQA